MSADSVDDLHAAEDALTEGALTTYCRPSCVENADYGGCEDEAECGCPCHHKPEGCAECGQTGWLNDG